MKAVVVELRNGYASVLSNEGCIVKIKDNNYEIGQVIQMNKHKNNTIKKIATFAASAAAIIVLGGSTWAYASPYSYVSLDVNPSIEFVLNRFDRVLSIKSVNDDGEEVLQEIKLENLKNKTIVQAINQTLDQISELGYFSDETTAEIVITTSNKDMDKADELAKEIKDEVEDEIDENHETALVEVYSVGLERVEAAKELGVTPGKLNLVEKLIASSNDAESINLNEWLSKPVKDIMKATKAYKNAISVTGSAIVLEDIEEDDFLSDKEAKEAAKEADKAAKEAQKAAKEADKAADKASKEADKIAKNATKAIEKAAKEAEKIAKKDKTEENKESEKAITEAAKEAERAAKEAAKEAERAAKEAEKAAKEAEKAAKEAKKAEKDNNDKSTKAAESEAKKAAKDAEKAAKEALKALENTKNKDISPSFDNKSEQESTVEKKDKSNGQADNNSNNSNNGKGPKR